MLDQSEDNGDTRCVGPGVALAPMTGPVCLQIGLELRHLLSYIHERATADICLEAKERLASADRWESWSLVQVRPWRHAPTSSATSCVQAMLAESKVDKRSEHKERHSRSVEELIQQGKWLSRAEQLHLSNQLTRYFGEWKPAGGKPTAAECFEFQNHLVVYLLNNGSIPVPRTQLLVKLRIGDTLKFNEERGVFQIEVSVTARERASPHCACCPVHRAAAAGAEGEGTSAHPPTAI
jgi:hypothetical protein